MYNLTSSLLHMPVFAEGPYRGSPLSPRALATLPSLPGPFSPLSPSCCNLNTAANTGSRSAASFGSYLGVTEEIMFQHGWM